MMSAARLESLARLQSLLLVWCAKFVHIEAAVVGEPTVHCMWPSVGAYGPFVIHCILLVAIGRASGIARGVYCAGLVHIEAAIVGRTAPV